MKKRVMMFVDSNNFHKDCENSLGSNSKPRFNWKDLLLGIRDLYKENEEDDIIFLKAYYYSALSDREDNPTIYDKHKRFLDAINKIKFIYVKLGHLARVPIEEGKKIVRTDPSTYKHIEKSTDVNISNDILENCLRNNCDVILLISADGDYKDTIERIKDYGKEFYLVLPIGTPADILKKLAGEKIIYLDKAFLQKYIR